MQLLAAQLMAQIEGNWVELIIFAIVALFSAAGGLANWLKERAKKKELGEGADAEADYEVVIGPDGEPMLRPVRKPAASPATASRPGTQPQPVPRPSPSPPPPRREPPPRDRGTLRPRSFPQTPVAQPIAPPPRPPAPRPAPAPVKARPVEPPRPRREAPVDDETVEHRPVSVPSEARLHEDEHDVQPSGARMRWIGPHGAERDALRRAFVLSEILAPPVALRDAPTHL